MTDLARLVVALEAQTAKYQEGLDKANKQLVKFQSKQNSILGSIDKRFQGFARGIGGVLAGLGLAFSFKGIIDATVDAEHAMALLDNAVKATGGSAGFTTEQLADMAKELQKITSYDDEAIMGMEQLLLRFQSIKGDTFTRATKDALDLAAALGKDLPEAATLIGKSLENPAKAAGFLAKAGILLTKQQQDLVKGLQASGRQAEAQNVILTALESKYRGAAEAVRGTLGGALSGLKNAFNDLLEAPGGMNDATAAINDLTNVLNSEEVKAGFASIVSGIATIVTVSAKGAATLADFAKWVGETFAAANNGVASGDLVRMSDQITEVQESLKRFQKLGTLGTFLNGGKEAVDNTIAGYQRQLAKLTDAYNQARIAKEKAFVDAGNTKPGDGKGGAGGEVPTGQSAEFDKLADKLKEQIALYGSVGQAARIAYEIQTGGLDELSGKEQQQLLALAQQLDAIDRVAGMAKDQIKALNDLGESIADTEKQFADMFKVIGDDNDLAKELAPDFEAMLDKNLDTYKASVDKQNEYELQAARNTQDILGGFLEGVFQGRTDNILKSFETMLQKMAAQAIAADIASKLFGTGEGGNTGWVGKGLDWLGGLFGKGGSMDDGGRGLPGHVYDIGVGAQPEKFVPDSAGTFYPRGEGMGGATSIVQNLYVQGSVDTRTRRQILLDTSRQTRNAMRLA